MAKKKPQQQQQQPQSSSSGGALLTPVLSQGMSSLGEYLYDSAGSAIGSAAPQVASTVAQTAPVAAEGLGLGAASAPYGFLTDGAGTAIGTAADATAAGTVGAESFLGSAAPWLGAAGAVYGAYNYAKDFGEHTALSGALAGATTGAGIGTMILPGVGTLVGAGIGGAVGAAGSAFKKSGKDKDQKGRDAVRSGLKKAGIVDENYNITTAQGGQFNIGKDGKDKLYNFDPNSTAYTTQTSGYAIPLSYLAGGGDQKLADDFAGYFTNAALSDATDGATAKANVRGIANKFGEVNAIKQQLTQLRDDGRLDQGKYDAALNGIDSLFDINAYAKSQPGGGGGQRNQSPKKVVVVQPEPQMPMGPVFTPASTSYTPSVMPGATSATAFGGRNSYSDLLEDMKRRTTVGRTY